jgi:hypothetical protein
MILGEVIAIIVITLLIGCIFYYGFKRTGPWGSFWTFLLILFFGIWASALWVEPMGPIWWNAAWFDLFIIALVFALLLASATPDSTRSSRYKSDVVSENDVIEREERTSSAVVLGLFFWLLLIILIGLIILGLAV